jgi:hypothetical protein
VRDQYKIVEDPHHPFPKVFGRWVGQMVRYVTNQKEGTEREGACHANAVGSDAFLSLRNESRNKEQRRQAVDASDDVGQRFGPRA